MASAAAADDDLDDVGHRFKAIRAYPAGPALDVSISVGSRPWKNSDAGAGRFRHAQPASKAIANLRAYYHPENLTRTQVAYAPYRAAPLGAHVDHQGGLVTGFATGEGILVVFARRENTNVCEVRSTHVSDGDVVRFEDNNTWDENCPPTGWHRYVCGAATLVRRLKPEHSLAGLVACVHTTTPGLHGQGVSSSAALTAALAAAMLEGAPGSVTPDDLVRLCRSVENDFCGLSCGILDMAVIVNSRRNHLLLVDCHAHDRLNESLSKCAHLLSAPSDVACEALLVFSGVRSNLAAEGGSPSPYNQRVAECRDAAQSIHAGAELLADVPTSSFLRRGGLLAAKHPHLFRRAAHYFGERQRVLDGCELFAKGKFAEFGMLMTESCHSSIHNYECGCAPLRSLFEALVQTRGVLGARYSGAGFRGAVLALCERGAGVTSGEMVLEQYRATHPEYADDATYLVCNLEDGLVVFDGDDIV